MGANYANLFEVVAGDIGASDSENRISELCTELETYLEPTQVEEIYSAYLVGAAAHEGQMRVSGEPYISHPIAVARILAEMRMDSKSIIAAILHDVIEDTPTLKENLADQFGDEVAELVDGVSKLAKMDFRSKAEAQAENFRKMMLAMVRDIRVIIIKLADRLHNMRLGIFKMRHELLDLSIKAAYPMRYRALESACKEVVGYRKEIFNTIEAAIRQRLKESNINATVKYRQKNIHSIYRKMKEKKLSFKELTDVFGVRIMTESVDDCYRVLGVMHNLYKPLPGKFKDYLAIPKTNGYQSLHSSLFGPHGVAIEVQIRTVEMDHFAESGIAAHWIYKEGESDATNTQGRALEWLKSLLEMQQKSGSSQEFLESVKVDLFPDEVYIFTPKGAIKKLPRGATVVDFAYAVHTDVGNTCVAARIDPHPSWLDFVSTAKARTNIRHFLKSLQKIEAISLGQRLLQQSVSLIKGRDVAIPKTRFKKVLEQYHMSDQKELLAEIGLGNRNSSLVAKAMYDIEEDTTAFDDRGRPLAIKGTEGMVVSFAKCCRPVPGDAIAGFMSSGKGIVIHQRSCPNMTELNKGDRQLSVQWSEHVEGEYLANMRVQVANQRGVLATLATTISNMSSNIEHVNVTEKDGRISTVEFVVTVKDRIHLARIMKKLRSLMVVNRIWRR
jgi:GTP pyrophosphokinase